MIMNALYDYAYVKVILYWLLNNSLRFSIAIPLLTQSTQ